MNWISNQILKPNKKKNQNENNDELNLIYHEKQVKELCALHALNNLFQEKKYTKAILDELCVELSPQEFLNPHRSILGRGNYNINVIMKAVQLNGYEALWFDKRRPITILNFINVKGFILNVPSDYKLAGILSLPWERKHWIAVTKINDVYFNLDSKLEKPEIIGNQEQLIAYLENLIKSKDKELFIIIPKECDSDGSWKV